MSSICVNVEDVITKTSNRFSRLTLQVLSVTNISFSPYNNNTQIRERLKSLQKPANAPIFYQICKKMCRDQCREIIGGTQRRFSRKYMFGEANIAKHFLLSKDHSKLIDDRSIRVLFSKLMQ